MNLKIDETQIFEFLGPSSIIYHQKKWVLTRGGPQNGRLGNILRKQYLGL